MHITEFKKIMEEHGAWWMFKVVKETKDERGDISDQVQSQESRSKRNQV